jgi:hypothetical protein
MFRRSLGSDTITGLRKDRLFVEKLKPDIAKGIVFPAIRASRFDFYHKGGKLFSYDRRFSTHKKYVSAIMSDSDYVSESDLQQKIEVVTNFFDGYEQIKENCSLYSGVEAEGVSRIYRTYPFTNNDSDIVVLDIEISFRAKSEERSQDRIDILLFNKKTQQLRFYEAKHYSNSELWSVEGTPPRVASQIRRYEEQIERNDKDIRHQYCNYVKIMNSLFGCDLPEPESIDERVTLLVFGYDRDQQGGRMKKLLLDDGSLAGIQYYSRGNISNVNVDNMWEKVKCF